MTSKVKVIIEHEDGYRRELNGDTAICFTVSDVKDFLYDKASHVKAQTAYTGDLIPDMILSKTIASLIIDIVENTSRNKTSTSLNFHLLAKELDKKGKEIRNSLTNQEVKDNIKDTFEQLMKTL